jgi:hypothetical protein
MHKEAFSVKLHQAKIMSLIIYSRLRLQKSQIYLQPKQKKLRTKIKTKQRAYSEQSKKPRRKQKTLKFKAFSGKNRLQIKNWTLSQLNQLKRLLQEASSDNLLRKVCLKQLLLLKKVSLTQKRKRHQLTTKAVYLLRQALCLEINPLRHQVK